MKKILFLLLSILTLFAALPVYAAPVNSIKSEKVLYEYDGIVDTQSKSDSQLKALGYSPSQINELRNINLDELLWSKYAEKNPNIAMKSATPLEKKHLVSSLSLNTKRALLASLTISHQITSHTYTSSEDKTYATIEFDWSWDKKPAFRFTDIVAFGWDGQMYLNSSNHTVTYESDTLPKRQKIERFKFDQIRNANAQSTIDVQKTFSGESGTFSAIEGYGYIKLHCGGKQKNLGVEARYGHKEVKLGAPAIAAPWGISFNLSNVSSEAVSRFQSSIIK